MEDWQYWVIAGMSLIVIESLIPGFIIAGVGIACFASGLASYFGMGYGVQGFILFGVTGLFFVTIRPIFIKLLYASPEETKTNVAALIGKTAIVTEEVNPLTTKGRVRIDGQDWWGVSEDEQVIPINEKTVIVKATGTQLIVRRKEGL